nr:hypothetical protein [Tanacetum cinerariifolium]
MGFCGIARVFLWWGRDSKAKRWCLVVQEVGLEVGVSSRRVFLWWGKDSKAKRGCLVVQEVGLEVGDSSRFPFLSGFDPILLRFVPF